jgi:hypothetical protein
MLKVLLFVIVQAGLSLAVAAELAVPVDRAHKADKAGPSLTTTVAKREPGSRFAWAGLGQDKTIALGELLKKAKFNRKVVIWCSSVDCTDLAADLDDAFQIADVKSDIDRREVDSSSDVGIFVGPFGEDAERLQKAIELTTGLKVKMVSAPEDADLALIIGKKPR